MTTKPFQIVMNTEAHGLLKARAKVLNVTIGEMIENLLASLEMRLRRSYNNGGFKERDISEATDKRGIEALLIGDREGWDRDKLDNTFLEIRMNVIENRIPAIMWDPQLKLN